MPLDQLAIPPHPGALRYSVGVLLIALSSWTATAPAQAQESATPAAPASLEDYDRPVSWKRLIPNAASDQKKIWLFPVRLAKGHGWVPAAVVVGVTAGLVALDVKTAPYFRKTDAFSGFNSVFTSKVTVDGTLAFPVAMYGIGLLAKNSKARNTALLMGEAIGDTYLVTTVMKDIDRRLQPIAVKNDNYGHTWFQNDKHMWRSNGSFPSGHTIAAFSVATVASRRYGKQHKWVPYVAYGLASMVGFSRITLSAHFVSDVFMGAALGYSITRFVVLRQ